MVQKHQYNLTSFVEQFPPPTINHKAPQTPLSDNVHGNTATYNSAEKRDLEAQAGQLAGRQYGIGPSRHCGRGRMFCGVLEVAMISFASIVLYIFLAGRR